MLNSLSNIHSEIWFCPNGLVSENHQLTDAKWIWSSCCISTLKEPRWEGSFSTLCFSVVWQQWRHRPDPLRHNYYSTICSAGSLLLHPPIPISPTALSRSPSPDPSTPISLFLWRRARTRICESLWFSSVLVFKRHLPYIDQLFLLLILVVCVVSNLVELSFSLCSVS